MKGIFSCGTMFVSRLNFGKRPSIALDNTSSSLVLRNRARSSNYKYAAQVSPVDTNMHVTDAGETTRRTYLFELWHLFLRRFQGLLHLRL